MNCESFCIAGSIDLQKAADCLLNKNYPVHRYSKKVLHINNAQYDVFVFSHGSIVTWGMDEQDRVELFEIIKPFAKNLLATPESDTFSFRYGNETTIFVDKKLNQDIIILESTEPQLKLAISYGLAQSVKLESFEQQVQNAVDKNAHLTQELALRGRIPLSRRDISKVTGEIFTVRSLVNLNSEYLDIPDYFWEYPALENYYSLTIRFLDLSKRVSALNQKLDVLLDLFNMLNNQLQHYHSSFLEWTIIILIFIEIIIMIFFYSV